MKIDISAIILLIALSIFLLTVLKMIGLINYSPRVGTTITICAITNLILSVTVTRR